MIKKLLLLSMVFVSACGQQEHSLIEPKIDSEFKKYVEYFETKTGDTVSVDMKFAVIDDLRTVARCYMFEDKKYNYVEVDPDYWFMELNESEREEVILHELGHCIYLRDHDEMILKGKDFGLSQNIYKSIMYPYVFGGDIYENHKQYYVDELKNPDTLLTNYL